ncbi:oxidoreductase [Nakamurella aerolata]|uniref:Oxidoreductase n=1 Tax=Nakamurella aerolata TaxID=1656892 RepID=A0A849ACI1_9ACTN|nr:oxidoreductase [Nakamurella aerolata]NNG36881.1 oxidoreductase [Nakamurella aerolata]
MTDLFELTGHQVKRMGFGAMQLPGPGVMGPPRDPDEARAVLRTAIELGINHVDTAQFYGPDVANELIRETLSPYPADLVLVSKVGARRDSAGAWLPAQRPAQLTEDVHANLNTLGVQSLPVVNLRVMPREEIPATEYVPLDEQLGAMQELVKSGALQAFGVSNVTLEQAEIAIDAGAVCVQNAYNLLHRDDDPVLQLTSSRGVGYVPFFPLGSAFPGLPKVPENPTVQAIAERVGVTASQVGLAWLLARADNILLIPGTSSVAHLRENTAAQQLTLAADDLQELDALAG